jgi:hypothetical protein
VKPSDPGRCTGTVRSGSQLEISAGAALVRSYMCEPSCADKKIVSLLSGSIRIDGELWSSW